LRVLIAGLTISLLLSVASPAAAGPVQELNVARSLVRHGKYKEAIPKLNFLLYPRTRLAARADLIEAHVLLGIAFFETGDSKSAAPELKRALFLDSSLTLDRLLFSKRAIEFFDGMKRKLDAQRRNSQAARQAAARRAALAKLLKEAYTLEKNSRITSFLPFGVGQFQNDQDRKGAFFFISQLVTGGASVGIFGFHVLKYGLNGAVPLDEASGVRQLQTIQVISGGVCLALMVWGIVDAQLNFQAKKLTRGIDKSLLEQLQKMSDPDADTGDADNTSDTDKTVPKPKPKPKPISFKLLPTATPRGGGLVMSWEF